MSLLNKEPVKRVEENLKNFNENLNIITLDTSARTALEAASSLGCNVGAIVKSLLFRAEDKYILCLVSGDKKVSLNKVKKLLNKKFKGKKSKISLSLSDEKKYAVAFVTIFL